MCSCKLKRLKTRPQSTIVQLSSGKVSTESITRACSCIHAGPASLWAEAACDSAHLILHHLHESKAGHMLAPSPSLQERGKRCHWQPGPAVPAVDGADGRPEWKPRVRPHSSQHQDGSVHCLQSKHHSPLKECEACLGLGCEHAALILPLQGQITTAQMLPCCRSPSSGHWAHESPAAGRPGRCVLSLCML